MPVVPAGAKVRVQVKDRQITQDADQEEPGETSLLYVTCEVEAPGGRRDLLQFEDEAGRQPEDVSPPYVHDERVYLRPANYGDWPFALLGEPPLSVWLPAGEYEIAVVYLGHRGFMNSNPDSPPPFPWFSERVMVDLPAGQRIVVRVPLFHHECSLDNRLNVRLGGEAAAGSEGRIRLAELEPLVAAIEKTSCVATPGGVLMDIPEPVIHHRKPHSDCEVDFQQFAGFRREWTRRQVQTLLRWLPSEAAQARRRLEAIDRSLSWREFLEGWYCYAAAGVAGLVFARWATIAKLNPYRRWTEFIDSLKLLLSIFFMAALLWILFAALSD